MRPGFRHGHRAVVVGVMFQRRGMLVVWQGFAGSKTRTGVRGGSFILQDARMVRDGTWERGASTFTTQ